jgi:hypothetical protein
MLIVFPAFARDTPERELVSFVFQLNTQHTQLVPKIFIAAADCSFPSSYPLGPCRRSLIPLLQSLLMKRF